MVEPLSSAMAASSTVDAPKLIKRSCHKVLPLSRDARYDRGVHSLSWMKRFSERQDSLTPLQLETPFRGQQFTPSLYRVFLGGAPKGV